MHAHSFLLRAFGHHQPPKLFHQFDACQVHFALCWGQPTWPPATLLADQMHSINPCPGQAFVIPCNTCHKMARRVRVFGKYLNQRMCIWPQATTNCQIVYSEDVFMMPHLDIMSWIWQSISVALDPCSWGTMDYTRGSAAHINWRTLLVYNLSGLCLLHCITWVIYYVHCHEEPVNFIRVGSTKGSGSTLTVSVPLGLSATWPYNRPVA